MLYNNMLYNEKVGAFNPPPFMVPCRGVDYVTSTYLIREKKRSCHEFNGILIDVTGKM